MSTGIVSFGEWTQKRRDYLGLTRASLANQVGCSPITIKKIERDERRPSLQIAELLAEHLRIPESFQSQFLQMARGEYVENVVSPQDIDTLSAAPTKPKLDRYKVLSHLDILPDQKLFGIETNRDVVIDVLLQEKRPWLIAFEGLGGLGKTTLANEIVHHFLDSDRFLDIGWVSAKQEEYITGRGIQPLKRAALTTDTLIDSLLAQLADGPYPISNQDEKRVALIRILKEKPCLVIVDNLETIEDYLALLPLIRQLSQPSKFIITSRMSLKNESDVHCLTLNELDEETTRQFLQHEANLQSIAPLLDAQPDTLNRIYSITGGNPLAIKLVIGQSQFLPLDHILNNLQLANETHVEQLYNYIYWQAWQMLDDNGRKLFMTLPIVPNGTFEQLTIASNLQPQDLQQALLTLQKLSLVKVQGQLTKPRYTIHRLTESFLMNEVIRWQETTLEEQKEEQWFFSNQIQAMVAHWQSNQAVQEIDVAELDNEKDAILKALHLGLEFDPAWPIIKELIISLSSYMERRGYWQTWEQTLTTAIHKARTLEDLEGELKLTTLRGRVLQRQNNTAEVIRNYRRAIRLARQTNNQIEEGRACSNLGYTFIAKGNWWRSEVFSCHALQLFNKLEYKHGQAHTHNHLGILYQNINDKNRAEKQIKLACTIWENLNDSHGLQYGLRNLGYLYNEMGNPRKAIEPLLKANQLVEQTGEMGELAAIHLNLGVSYEQLGDLQLAEKYTKKAETQFKQNGNFLGVCFAWEGLGVIYKTKNNQNEAKDYFESSLDGYVELNFKAGEIRIRKLLNEINQL